MTDQVSKAYKATGKGKFSYILKFLGI